MVPDSSVRLSGIAAILAGILWIFIEFLVEPLGLPGFRVIPPLEIIKWPLLIVFYFGLRSAQSGRDGTLGKVGLVIAVIGGLFLTIAWGFLTIQESVRGLTIKEGSGFLDPIGIFGSVLGFLLLGVAAIRAKVLPRWAAAAFMLGFPIGMVIRITTGSLLGFLLFIVSLFWLGYALWSGRTGKTAALTA